MPQYLITSPEGKKFRITAPEGATKGQALEYAKAQFTAPEHAPADAFAAEDAARKAANEAAPWYAQLGTGIKTQAGRTMLGVGELVNNLAGDSLIDPEVLAEAQREADRRDAGTGAAGFVGNMAGDFRNYLAIGGANAALKAKTLGQAVKQSAKVGATSGAITGLTEGSGDAESTVLTNLGNAAIGTGTGATIGTVLPLGATGAKQATGAVGGGVNRAMAAFGSDAAAEKVAYDNISKLLSKQGYAPGQVAGIIDEFKAQGIDGGTLGQMLQSGDLLAREKNLLQGGGEAGRIVGEKLDEQPQKIAQSILGRVNELRQPEQTAYLYGQATELADAPTSRTGTGGNTLGMGQSASAKVLPFTLNAIEENLAARGDELPPTVLKRVQRIVASAKGGGFEAADTAKKRLDDLYKANSTTTDQDIVNETVLGYRKMLNDALERAGGGTYKAAKDSALRDMAMTDVEDAVKSAQGASVKTALNKFFGSMGQQEEFLRKVPAHQRGEVEAYLANLQKVSGRFGGSDTASNTAAGKQMGIETGLGFDANALNPQSWINRVSEPISRNVRKAQAEVSFAPDADRLAEAMRKGDFSSGAPAAIPGVLSTEATKAAITTEQHPKKKPVTPTVKPAASLDPDLIKAEGAKTTSYTDTTGHRTIGIGFNMDDPSAKRRWLAAGIKTPFQAAYSGKAPISREDMTRLAMADQLMAQDDARRLVAGFDRLSPNRQAALTQMAYQLGGPRMAKFAPTLKLVEDGKYDAAAERLLGSRYAKQTPGRASEIARMLANDTPYGA